MIVKKLYKTTHHKHWNEQQGDYNIYIHRYYCGYFLFGIIPLYIKMIDKEVLMCDEPIVHDVYYKYRNRNLI